MANFKKGEVEIQLADGSYTMRFDFNVLCTIEERLNKSIDQLFFQGNISRLAIREAITVALKARHPNITAKKVGRLIEPSKMQEYVVALFEGLAHANGQSEEDIEMMKQRISEETDDEIIDIVEVKEDDNPPLALTATTGTS